MFEARISRKFLDGVNGVTRRWWLRVVGLFWLGMFLVVVSVSTWQIYTLRWCRWQMMGKIRFPNMRQRKKFFFLSRLLYLYRSKSLKKPSLNLISRTHHTALEIHFKKMAPFLPWVFSINVTSLRRFVLQQLQVRLGVLSQTKLITGEELYDTAYALGLTSYTREELNSASWRSQPTVTTVGMLEMEGLLSGMRLDV